MRMGEKDRWKDWGLLVREGKGGRMGRGPKIECKQKQMNQTVFSNYWYGHTEGNRKRS